MSHIGTRKSAQSVVDGRYNHPKAAASLGKLAASAQKLKHHATSAFHVLCASNVEETGRTIVCSQSKLPTPSRQNIRKWQRRALVLQVGFHFCSATLRLEQAIQMTSHMLLRR